MPINASPQYYKAEAEYLAAQTIEEKIARMNEVIRLAPKHKSSEKLLAHLKLRLAKLKKESERKGKKKSGSRGIKKTGDAQCIVIGKENTGKSLLLAKLTNARPVVSELPFTTTKPEIGTLDLEGLKVQLIELPANVNSEDFSVVYGADLVLILVASLEEIIHWAKIFKNKGIKTKKIIALNKIDILDEEEIKKVSALKNIIKISVLNGNGMDELRQDIFNNLGLIRVYTKEPGKRQTAEPLILKKESPVKDVAEKIHKEYLKKFIKAKIWGNSAKFPGQTVGMGHKLKDRDIVELYIK